MAQNSGSEGSGSLRLGAPISLGKAEMSRERGHEAASPQRRVLGGGGWENLPGAGAHDRSRVRAPWPDGHREVWEGLGHLGVLAGPAWWG